MASSNSTGATPGAPGAPGTDTGGRIGLRLPIIIGFTIIALFFGALGGWAALAPLESAAIAPGEVTIDSNRKTIQHLEGGIIGEILVRDGDEVTAGQVLFRLDDTQPRATLDLMSGRRRPRDQTHCRARQPR